MDGPAEKDTGGDSFALAVALATAVAVALGLALARGGTTGDCGSTGCSTTTPPVVAAAPASPLVDSVTAFDPRLIE